MIEYLNPYRTLGCFEAEGGEYGFVRYAFSTVKAEIPGFSAATIDRTIVEAVYVPADQVAFAALVLHGRTDDLGLAEVLAARGIDARQPTTWTTAGVRPLRHVATEREAA